VHVGVYFRHTSSRLFSCAEHFYSVLLSHSTWNEYPQENVKFLLFYASGFDFLILPTC
jgi:hypothetical protein